MKSQNNYLAPFEWGNGKHTLEMFLEPTCPYSAKAFNKIDALLAEAKENQLKVMDTFVLKSAFFLGR